MRFSINRFLAAVAAASLTFVAAIAAPAGAVSCSFKNPPFALTFNPFNPLATSPNTLQFAVIQYTCDGDGDALTLTLSTGANSTSFAARKMKRTGGTELLQYNLFLDSGFNTIWGDGTGGSSPITATSKKNAAQTITLFGRIPAAVAAGTNDVPPGSYSDTLTATINF